MQTAISRPLPTKNRWHSHTSELKHCQNDGVSFRFVTRRRNTIVVTGTVRQMETDDAESTVLRRTWFAENLVQHIHIAISRLLDLLYVLGDNVVESREMIPHLQNNQPDVDELLLVHVKNSPSVVVHMRILRNLC